MESMTREFRQVFRKLTRSPSFTLVAVLTLALGIGANAAIFTVVHSILIRPLPYPDQDALVVPQHTAPGMGVTDVPHSEATYLIYAQDNRVFQAIGVYRQDALNLTGGQEPERVPAVRATHEVLSILGAVPQVGRLTNEEDDLPGSLPVAILTQEIWQRRYGADPSVVGRTIQLNGVSHEVVGILPAGFRFMRPEAEIFVPARFDRAEPDEGSFDMTGIARMKDGVTMDAVRADMARMIRLMPERYSGDINQAMLDQIGFAPRVVTLKEATVGDVSRTLWIILSAVGFVLLIACANVANLFLVRAEGRQREVAVRTALGASGRDMARYFLTESLTLGLVGGIGGLLLAWAGTRALVAFGPENLPRVSEISMDLSAILFTLGISLLAGLLFGLVPVLKYRTPQMASGLKEGGRGGSAGKERHRVRNTLVVSQMAMALVLLVGSGLMIRSFQALRNVDPGFDPLGVLTLRITLPDASYPGAEDRVAFYERLQESLAGLPGVVGVGAGSGLPLAGGVNRSGTWFEDFPITADEVPDVIETNRVTAGFLETMGARLLEGRTLDAFDARDRTGAVVVTRALAEHYWPGESALGKHLSQNSDVGRATAESDIPWQTIVGVVEDVRTVQMDQEPVPLLFFPLLQDIPDGGSDRTPNSMARLSGITWHGYFGKMSAGIASKPPVFRASLYCSTKSGSPEVVPIETPTRYGSRRSSSIPASETAMCAAATAIWEALPRLAGSWLRTCPEGSKPLTSAPRFPGKSEVSNDCTGAMPLLPEVTASQNSFLPEPTGVTSPIPVIAILFIFFTPSVATFAPWPITLSADDLTPPPTGASSRLQRPDPHS